MIEMRLERRNEEDLIFLGDLVEQAAKTEFWKLLRAMTIGRKSYELQKSSSGIPASADRVLGRLEAYETILSDLQTMVEEKNRLTAPLEPEAEDILEPEKVSQGGEI